MLSVFICEDDSIQKKNIETHIRNVIMMEEYEMKIELSTDNPISIIEYLDGHPNTIGIYFLDIDLKCEMNGIQLAAKIREVDMLGNIIFITTHSELALTTFKYKIEALDFIIKDIPREVGERVKSCLELVNTRYANRDASQQIQIKIGNEIRLVNMEEIIYVETSPIPHKLIIHMENCQLEFYSSIRDILSELNKNETIFKQVHQSYVINSTKIDFVNKKDRKIYFMNGDFCFASYRGLKSIKDKEEANE